MQGGLGWVVVVVDGGGRGEGVRSGQGGEEARDFFVRLFSREGLQVIARGSARGSGLASVPQKGSSVAPAQSLRQGDHRWAFRF